MEESIWKHQCLTPHCNSPCDRNLLQIEEKFRRNTFLKLWSKAHNIKISILTVFKCAVQSCEVCSHYCTTRSPEPFILKTQTLNPLDSAPLPSSTWQSPFYLLYLWVWLLWIPQASEIQWYLSFCCWLISFSIMSSGFVLVVAYNRISFFF